MTSKEIANSLRYGRGFSEGHGTTPRDRIPSGGGTLQDQTPEEGRVGAFCRVNVRGEGREG